MTIFLLTLLAVTAGWQTTEQRMGTRDELVALRYGLWMIGIIIGLVVLRGT